MALDKNEWFKKGARSARHYEKAADAVIAAGILPKEQEHSFIRGYYSGRYNAALDDLQQIGRYMTDAQLVKFGDAIMPILKEVEAEVIGATHDRT